MTSRQAAVMALFEVENSGAYSDKALKKILGEGNMPPAEKALAVMGRLANSSAAPANLSTSDEDSARLEWDLAQRAFEDLGARPDLAALAALRGPAQRAWGGLTPRELEVLRQLAAGKTNRSIAGELQLSGKTVDRHVSNIFDKLGVSSRAAATALAYQRHLL